ncbi:MAG: isopentenyl phosphate kinase [Promethearchaeota archaeon]
MTKLVLAKLGGSVITRKDVPRCEDAATIERLADEVAEAFALGGKGGDGEFRLVLGTGGGSFPHQVAHRHGVAKGLYGDEDLALPSSQFESRLRALPPKRLAGFALTQDAAAEINRLVVRRLLARGLPAISLQPSAFLYCDGGVVARSFVRPARNLLAVGALPVVYGDVVTDLAKGCAIASTEVTLALLARELKANRLVVCTDVDGVYSSDPRADPDAQLVGRITPRTFGEVRLWLGGSSSTDVTGGMLHKVQTLLALALEGVPSLVVNGRVPGRLRDALLGNEVVGTRIEAVERD